MTPWGDPLLTQNEAQVIRLYRAVLGRAPDAGGFAFWVRARDRGVSLDNVADGFVQSSEFGIVYGAPSDEAFIELMYRNVLDRGPDDLGRDFWLHQMAAGLSRTRVVVLFSESLEFVSLSQTQLTPLAPFVANVSEVSAEELGSSWREGCPVAPDQLRRVEMSVLGFDGEVFVGQLIVNAAVANEVAEVFAALYEARYPIESMLPIDRFASDDLASMEVNNTSSFNCRPVTGGTSWSHHAFGRAIDVNPRQNPYVTSSMVLPSGGDVFVDRSVYHPAMIDEGDLVVELFAAIGWRWGGDFTSLKDWHHFDRAG